MNTKKTLDTHYTSKVDEYRRYQTELAQLKEDDSSDVHVKKQIEELEQKYEDELDFYVNNASILYNYYNIVENNNDHQVISNVNEKQGILKFFINEVKTEDVGKRKTLDKASLLEKYIAQTSSNYVKPLQSQDDTNCPNCGSCNRVTITNDSIICCNNCNHVEHIIVDHEKPSYKEAPREVTYFAYRRINHLNEWISQVQGKETTDIPEEVYDKILLEIKKQRITNMATLTTKHIRSILKKLKLTKYYEHIPHIVHKLNGLPIPNFEPELEEKLRTMFKIIQPLFLKYAPPSRKNFLSYSYILFKFLQLLGRDEFLSNFNLLKNREKLHEQDQVWSKICNELGWDFIRSI